MTNERKLVIITDEVCKYYNVKVRDLGTHSHKRQFSEPRQVIFYFARKLTNISLFDIGKEFYRDHATVLHGEKTIRGLVKVNGFSKIVDAIWENIDNRFEDERRNPVRYCTACGQPLPC